LITVLSCYGDGMLTDVVFIQGGNHNGSAVQISRDYFTLAGCSTNLLQNCYPEYGSLTTASWSIVLNLFLEGAIGIRNGSALTGTNSTIVGIGGFYFEQYYNNYNDDDNNGNDDDDNNGNNYRRMEFVRFVEEIESAEEVEEVDQVDQIESNSASYIFTIVPLLFLTLMIFL